MSGVVGRHVLLDLWGGNSCAEENLLRQALIAGAEAGGATILGSDFRQFPVSHEGGTGGGVTGVLLLAESHITIHSWPEHDYAAVDLFLCGPCDAEAAAQAVIKVLVPREHRMVSHLRGTIPPSPEGNTPPTYGSSGG